MNKLYKQLNTLSKENQLRVKSKKQKESELVQAAWITHKHGYISAFDYARIANKNNQPVF